MRNSLLRLFLTILIFTVSSLPAFGSGEPILRKIIGTNEGRFNYIGKCALDVQGNLYITDRGNHRIQKFDAQGNFLRFFGGYGTGPGQFNFPWGVKVDQQGFLYVADLMNSRIQKLNPDGSVALIIRNVQARNIDVDALGNIYTVDGLTSFYKYDASGNLLWKVGNPRDPNNPDDPFYLGGALSLALGEGGKIYVPSYGGGKIRIFDTDGNYLDSHFIIDDQLVDIALDRQGKIYVSECNSFRVGVFDANFNRLYNIPGEYYTDGVTVDPQGNVYLTNALDRMIKIDPQGVRQLSVGSNGSGSQEFAKPLHLSKDRFHNVYLTDPIFRNDPASYGSSWKLGNHRIRKLDYGGNFLLTFGQNGTGPGQFFHAPAAVAVDSAGTIFVGSNRYDPVSWVGSGFVQKFDAQGQFIADFLTFGDANAWVRSLTMDRQDILYVPFLGPDLPNLQINKFFQDGVKTGTVIASDPTLYPVPLDVQTDSRGNIFLALDLYIAKFDPSGNLLFLRTGMESGAGEMRAFGLDVDAADNVWVADTYHHRILCFDNNGNFLLQFGKQGFGPGEFQLPQDVAVVAGRLFVADTYNSRVQIFDVGLPPKANAGENLRLSSEQQGSTIIYGTASGPEGSSLTYRWKKGPAVLLDWQPVGLGGTANLNLSGLTLPVGTHTLTLEVSDGLIAVSDDMILTIDNAAPHAAPTGVGTYEFGQIVILSGEVADFDGDQLGYTWKEGGNTLASGTVATTSGGMPAKLPDFQAPGFSVGTHLVTLQVDDGVNAPVSQTITLKIIDTQAPVLAPVVNQSILWPPSHQMVDMVIKPNATDNSGSLVALSASITCNEPVEGSGDGATSPDWTKPQVDPQTGAITFQLRAERSAKGSGRIYTVAINATDASGNASTAEVSIMVPHDRRWN